jgi:hypothetical protein
MKPSSDFASMLTFGGRGDADVREKTNVRLDCTCAHSAAVEDCVDELTTS